MLHLVCSQPGASSGWETLVPHLLWGPGPQQCLEGSPTGWDPQHPLMALRHALVTAKPTERARRRGFAVGQHPQHSLPVGQGSALGTPSLQGVPSCQAIPQGGAGSGLGAVAARVLATSSQELSSSLLWHLFGSTPGRSSRDEVPEPACITKPAGRLGLMTDANPPPPKFPFCQPKFLSNSL